MQKPPGGPDPESTRPSAERIRSDVQRQAAPAPGTPTELKVDKQQVKNFAVDYLETAKLVCLTPNYFFENMPREGGFVGPTIFLCVGAGISAVLSGILITHDIVQALGQFVLSVLLVMAMARGLDYLLKQFGGKGNFEETYRVMCYSSPPLLLTWLPMISPFAFLYMAVLWIMGLRRMHDLM